MSEDFLIRLIYMIMTNSQIVTTRILIMQATNKIKNISECYIKFNRIYHVCIN